MVASLSVTIQGSSHQIRRSAAVGGISDRKQEIKRRRKRRAKINHFKQKLKKATTSEKLVMAEKIRKMTSGAETIISDLALEERK